MPTSILQVKGIGPATAEKLAAAGFTTAEALAEATPQQLVRVPGFGESRAMQVIALAGQMVAEASADAGEGQALNAAGGKSTGAPKSKTGKKLKNKEEKKTKKNKPPKDKTKKSKAKKGKAKKGKAKKGKTKKDKTKKSGAKKKAKKK